jgi:hypothetical protein
MTTARVEDAGHERLVGPFESRDVDHPHLADVPRRLVADHEHLALSSGPSSHMFRQSTKLAALALN